MRPTSKRAAYAALVALSSIFAAPLAQGGEPGASYDGHRGCTPWADGAECVDLLVDHSLRLELSGVPARIFLGNAAVADISPIRGSAVAVVTARSVGTTNVMFLTADGDVIDLFEVYVREPDIKRVVMRMGSTEREVFQCAPRCERTLTQIDSPDAHSKGAKQIETEFSLGTSALGATQEEE